MLESQRLNAHPSRAFIPTGRGAPTLAPLSHLDSVRLNNRDREVLTLLTWGRTNQEMAEELCVSITTVKTYVRFAYRKIGVTRRTQAVVWGYTHGLFPTASNSHEAEA